MTFKIVKSDMELLRAAVDANDLSELKKTLENPNVDMQALDIILPDLILNAACDEKWEIVEYLLNSNLISYYENSIDDLQHVFKFAVGYKYLPAINRLLEPDCLELGFNPSANDNQGIRDARDLSILNRLLQSDCIALGVDPAADCNMELMENIGSELFIEISMRLLEEKRVRETLTEEQCTKVNEFIAKYKDAYSQYLTYDYPIIPGAGHDVVDKLQPIYIIMYEYFPEMREEYFYPNGKPTISNQRTYLFNIWLEMPGLFKTAVDNDDFEMIKKITGFAEWIGKQHEQFSWLGVYKFWIHNLQNHPKLIPKMLPWYSPEVIKDLFYTYDNFSSPVAENKELNPGYEETYAALRLFAARRHDPTDERNPNALRPINSKMHLYLQNTYWNGEIEALLKATG